MFGRRGSGKNADLPEESGAATAATGGPYDSAEAPTDDGIQRLDLGSMLLPAIGGVEVQMQGDENGQLAAVILGTADSALQVAAYAAPRTEGIWDEVRADILASVKADGGETEEVEGEHGTELLARVPTPDGVASMRFVGIDGPRWFLRGQYQGKAAVEADAAGPLAEALRHLVVVRDKEARPVREPLPLRLPKDIAEQMAAQQADQAADGERKPSPGPRDSENGH